MSIEIIRVEEPRTPSLGERAVSAAKERPYLAAVVAIPAGVVLAPFIASSAVTVVAGTLGGAAVAGVSELVFGPDAKPPVTIFTVEEAKSLSDVHGQPLVRGETYMRLPRHSRERGIIRSSEFHAYVMSQKVAELIHYMRAETRLKALSILIRSSDRKHLVVGGELIKASPELRGEVTNQHERRMVSNYDDGARLPHFPSYSWINDFPEVVAATRKARHGTMSFAQATDMSFGLAGSVAKFANFKGGWLSTFIVEIDATFS